MKHKVMVLGCVGRMGSYLADEVKKAGFQVRSLIWDADRAANLPPDIDRVEGLLNDVSRLSLPLEEVEALVAQVGLLKNVGNNPEVIDYESLRNLLLALEGRPVHVIVITAAESYMNTNEISTTAYEQMRRAEMMVRCSGIPYTVVRSGKVTTGLTTCPRVAAVRLTDWQTTFGERAKAAYEDASERCQISARQVSAVIAGCILNEQAYGKSLELFGEAGPEQKLEEIVGAIEPDNMDADALLSRNDTAVALSNFPPAVIDDIRQVRAQFKQGQRHRTA